MFLGGKGPCLIWAEAIYSVHSKAILSRLQVVSSVRAKKPSLQFPCRGKGLRLALTAIIIDFKVSFGQQRMLRQPLLH